MIVTVNNKQITVTQANETQLVVVNGERRTLGSLAREAAVKEVL